MNSSFVAKFSIPFFIVIFSYISFIPFYYLQPVHLSPQIESFSLLKYWPFLGVLLLFFLSFFVRSAESRLSPQITKLATWAGVYVVFSAASIVGSSFPMIGIFKLFYYSSTGLLLAYSVYSIVQTRDEIEVVLKSICLIAVFTTLYGIICYVGQRDFLWEQYSGYQAYLSGAPRVDKPLGNAVYMGAYIALCLPVAFFYLWASREWTEKLVAGVSVFILCIGLVLTYTRGAMLGAVVGGLVFFNIYFDAIKKRINIRVVVAVAIAGYIILGIGFSFAQQLSFARPIVLAIEALPERFGSLVTTGRQGYRIAQYKTTLQILKVHPLLGVGYGNFTRVVADYIDPEWLRRSHSQTTENMYLMILAESGILGFGAIMALLVVLIRIFVLCYRNTVDPEQKRLLLMFLAIAITCVVNMVTWDAFNQPTVRMTFWALMGLGLKATIANTKAVLKES